MYRASAIFVGVYEPTKQKLLKMFPENLSALAHFVSESCLFVSICCMFLFMYIMIGWSEKFTELVVWSLKVFNSANSVVVNQDACSSHHSNLKTFWCMFLGIIFPVYFTLCEVLVYHLCKLKHCFLVFNGNLLSYSTLKLKIWHCKLLFWIKFCFPNFM